MRNPLGRLIGRFEIIFQAGGLFFIFYGLYVSNLEYWLLAALVYFTSFLGSSED